MTSFGTRTAVGCAAAGLALALVLSGCSKEEAKSSSSSPSAASSSAASSTAETSGESSAAPAAAAPADYYALFMKAESIPPTPAGPFTAEAPEDHSNGGSPDVRQFYKSGDNSIQSEIEIFPDASAAAAYVKPKIEGMAASITGGTPAPAPNVGADGMVLNGTSTDGSASLSTLVFSEQNAVVTLTFLGKAGDAVSPDYLDSVGVIQLDAVQQGLPVIGN
jgi:hypothetical protein